MTTEQAVQIISQLSNQIDALMLLAGLVGASIVAITWKG